ncbi:hypothetical protein EPN95_01210 [Patescibacteria group bacterium]|nr:MAG: hypothetical protein EPN95_01210 [Patescibacteria group bacterium]
MLLYKRPYSPKPYKEKNMSKMSFRSLEESQEFSIRRTRRTLHDLVRCNNFDLFVTFTFDPKKVNRYDMGATFVKMQSWLWRQHQKNHDFKYLIVPEKHKDGAIHFHALMADYPFSLKKTNVIQDSRRVFNITAFRFGFTNATYLPDDDKDKVGNYIAKYITKDMITLHNKRRYWSSKNLKKPITYYNSVYDLGLNDHLDHTTEILETDFNTMFHVPKDSL